MTSVHVAENTQLDDARVKPKRAEFKVDVNTSYTHIINVGMRRKIGLEHVDEYQQYQERACKHVPDANGTGT
jgi:hypothetical protein